MASITEKRKIKTNKQKTHKPLFYSHTASSVSEKKKRLYVITIFLKACLKKHASFIDEVPDIKKLRLFSQSAKKECNDCRQAYFCK